MDKKKPTRAADDDAKFEAFLKKQFAELRAELDSQIAQSSAKAGQVVPFSPRITSWAKRNAKWKYSIAAAVIVAVAVPMVLQLNRQKAELARQSSAPTLEQAQRNSKTLQDRVADREEAEKDADAPLPAGNAQSKENYYTRKKSAPAKDARVIDDLKGNREKQAEIPRQPAELAAGRSEGYLSKEETNSAESAKLKNAPASAPSGGEQVAASRDKSERSVSAGAPAPAAPAAAAPEQAPVFAAKKRSAAPLAEAENKRDAASIAAADEVPAAKPRSFSLDDTNAKLKKQSIAEEERAEMEKLWKEYEKDPQAFNKDKNRSARLRTLLARHDTKSRARRMISK